VTRVLKFPFLVLVGMLVFAVPSAGTHTGQATQPCTSATSSMRIDEQPVTIWYPPGCAHP
jgi:hypothetical protein